MIRIKHVLFLLIIIILASAIVVKLSFSRGWFVSYLSVNKPVSPELLVVEGWVSPSTIHLAAKEFQDKAYSRILTSGSPTEPAYLLSEDGYLEFSFRDQAIQIYENDTIAFRLKGSPVQGIYPEFEISVNGHALSKGFASGTWDQITHITDSTFLAVEISISFLNDTHFMGEDRNLMVESLYINSTMFPARAEDVLYFKKSDHQRLNPGLSNFASVAEICAHELQKQGIPEYSIGVIPSPVSDKNRTLASALVISEYLQVQELSSPWVNIASEGIHARRTWLSYKYALRKQAKAVGIICIPPAPGNDHSPQSYSTEEILRELAGIAYFRLLVNKKRFRKQLKPDLPVSPASF